jgi:hypothetical protein
MDNCGSGWHWQVMDCSGASPAQSPQVEPWGRLLCPEWFVCHEQDDPVVLLKSFTTCSGWYRLPRVQCFSYALAQIKPGPPAVVRTCFRNVTLSTSLCVTRRQEHHVSRPPSRAM